MKTEKIKTEDGESVTRHIPETPEEEKQLQKELGASAGTHSFADGRAHPPNIDEMEVDPELGDVKTRSG